MLKKQYRLPKGTSISGRVSISTPYFTMKIVNNSLSLNRFGFVVSKKVDVRATKRNSIKRKIRAQIEGTQEKMIKGYDLLIIVKKQALEAPTKDLHNTVEKAMIKQQLLK